MENIYCISGFGADKRAFSKLNFSDHSVTFIPWYIPEKNQSLEAYIQRFVQIIGHHDPVLIGLSFGGMVSIEIAKQISAKKILLISSVKTTSELPWLFRFAGRARLNKMLPLKPYSFLEPLENYNLGVETGEEKMLAREYRQKVDQQYVDWAIDQIINWENKEIPENVVHVHGTKDHIFPIKNIKADYVIEGGGHFMIMNRAQEINEILKKELDYE